MCGALIARNDDGGCFIFIVPITTRLSLGTTTHDINRGDMTVVRITSVGGIANCIHNNYDPINVGGRCAAIFSRDILTRRGICISNNHVNARIYYTPTSLVQTTETAATGVVFWNGAPLLPAR